MNSLTSVILPCCNQGEWVRSTVEQVRASMGAEPHEIIIVDDHSTDGSCHDLPADLLIVRPEQRLGVSGARRLAVESAEGDVLLFADPHCSFPDGALPHLAELARRNWAVIQPPTARAADSTKIAWGGRLIQNERGVALGNANRGEPNIGLINTIYCLQRTLYDSLGGWPYLPGVWGYSEQAMSLLCWFTATPVIVANTPVCVHHMNHVNRRLSFPVSTAERGANGHLVHKAFLPCSYEEIWRPILLAKYGNQEYMDKAFNEEPFLRLVKQIRDRAVRTEEEFFEIVLRQTAPDVAYVYQQRERSNQMGTGVSIRRLRDVLHWFKSHVPGCLRGRSVLDLGARDGRFLELIIRECRPRLAEGVELLDEVAAVGRQRGLILRTGDIRQLPDGEETWDVVTCIHTLEHLEDPGRGVDEMLRVLVKGGRLLIVVPREPTPNKEYAHNSCFPDSRVLERLLVSRPQIDPKSIRRRIAKFSGQWEIAMTARKRT